MNLNNLFSFANVQKVYLVLLLLITLTGCFELREEVEMHKDGSGNYRLLLDMSQSKQLIDLAQKLQQEKDPEATKNLHTTIDSTLTKSSLRFNTMRGISAAKDTMNTTDYIFGISFHFQTLEALNTAIAELNRERGGNYEMVYQLAKNTIQRSNVFYLKYINETLQRNIVTNTAQGAAQKNWLQGATYVYLIKVDGKIKKFSNENADLDYTKQILRLSVPLVETIEGKTDLSNTIKFK